MTLEQLFQRAGGNMAQVAAVGRGADDYTLMANALRNMNVPVQEVRSAAGTLEDAAEVIRSKPNGVVTFSVRFVKGGSNEGHRLFANFSRAAGLIIRDPHGQTYRSVADLIETFGKSATLSGSPMLFIYPKFGYCTGGKCFIASCRNPKLVAGDRRAGRPEDHGQGERCRDGSSGYRCS
jgi:hypothetical protein